MSTYARQMLAAVLGKITAFYEPLENPYLKARKKEDPFTSREQWEKRLMRKVRGEFASQLKELLDLLGDPPWFENVPESFWEGHSAELRRIFEDTMTDVALERAEEYLVAAPIGGVDWMQIHSRTVDWSRQYSYDLVKDITDSQREALRKEVPAFFESGDLTVEDIGRRLEAQFSAQRAEMIAVTEITRAAVEGDREIVKEIESFGIRMQAIFQTANDDIVCEVCGPLDGQPVEENEFPPLHPNCRCWLRHEVVE